MSLYLIRTPVLYRSPIGSPLELSNSTGLQLRARWAAVIACGLLCLVAPSLARGQERVILQQSVIVPASGSASNLYVPRRTTVSFDVNVESGKRLLMVVLTETQWQAVSAGEKAEGEPLLRIVVSGVETRSIVLDRGTFVVAFIAQDNQTSTRLTLRARGGAS